MTAPIGSQFTTKSAYHVVDGKNQFIIFAHSLQEAIDKYNMTPRHKDCVQIVDFTTLRIS